MGPEEMGNEMQLFDLVTSGLPNKQTRGPAGEAGGESVEAAEEFGAAMNRSLMPAGETQDAPALTGMSKATVPAPPDAHASLAAASMVTDDALAARIAPKSPTPGTITEPTAGTAGSIAADPGTPAAAKTRNSGNSATAVTAQRRPHGGPRGNDPGPPDIIRAGLAKAVLSREDRNPVKPVGRGAALPAQSLVMPTRPDATGAAITIDQLDLPEPPLTPSKARPGAPDAAPNTTANRVPKAHAKAPRAARQNGEQTASQPSRATVSVPPIAAPVAVATVTAGGSPARAGRPDSTRGPKDRVQIAEPVLAPREQPREMPIRSALPPAPPPGPGPGAGVARHALQGATSTEVPGFPVPPTQPQGPAPAAMSPPLVVERGLLPQIVQAVTPGAAPGTMEVMLDPPELGRVEIVLELSEQTVRATLTAERPATGELIRRHMDQLAEQFREAGFEDIDLNFSDRRAGHGRPGDAEPDIAATLVEERSATLAKPRPMRPAPAGTDGMDLRL